MKKMLGFLGVFIFASLYSFAAVSEGNLETGLEPRSNDQKLVLAAQLLKASNISGSISIYRSCYKSQADFAVCDCDLSPEKVKKYEAAWLRALKLEFVAEEFERELLKYIAEAFSAKELKKLIEFRQTELGRKVVAAETTIETPENSTLESDLAVLSVAAKELNNDPRRKAVLEKLIALSGGAALQAHIVATIGVSIASGFQHAQSNTKPVHPELGSQSQIAAASSIIKVLVEPLMLPSYALLYKNLSSDELERYLVNRQTLLSKKLVVVSIEATQAILTNLSRRIGATFAKELGRQDI